MSADVPGFVPESVDAWRAVTANRIYQADVPLDRFTRLLGSLADAEGRCRFRLEFGRDALGAASIDLTAEADLPLVCQRSLQRFVQPVRVEQKLGLLRSEREEKALAPETEPVLVPADGMLNLLDLVEDELILALPVVPLSPRDPEADADNTPEPDDGDDEQRVNPFAALAALKQKSS